MFILYYCVLSLSHTSLPTSFCIYNIDVSYTKTCMYNIESACDRKIWLFVCGLLRSWWYPVASIFMQMTWPQFLCMDKTLLCLCSLIFLHTFSWWTWGQIAYFESFGWFTKKHGYSGSSVACWLRILWVYSQQMHIWVIWYQVRNLRFYFIVSIAFNSVWGFLFPSFLHHQYHFFFLSFVFLIIDVLTRVRLDHHVVLILLRIWTFRWVLLCTYGLFLLLPRTVCAKP